MSSYASFIFLFLFSFVNSLRVFAQDPTYLSHVCPNTTTFSRNSTYLANLRTLLSSLSSPNADYSTGFQNAATVGEPPDRVSGYVTCFHVSPELCRRCVAFAVEDSLIRCPNEKEAVLNYKQCMLSYEQCMLSYEQCMLKIRDSAQNPPNYLYHNCPNTPTFTRNSTYSTNLITLLFSLSSQASLSDGFQNATAGEAPDILTGLFLCRGDLSMEVCRRCVVFAVSDTFTRCPNEKEVTLYYEECMLRYSNRNIISTLNPNGGIIMSNTQNITSTKSGSETSSCPP